MDSRAIRQQAERALRLYASGSNYSAIASLMRISEAEASWAVWRMREHYDSCIPKEKQAKDYRETLRDKERRVMRGVYYG